MALFPREQSERAWNVSLHNISPGDPPMQRAVVILAAVASLALVYGSSNASAGAFPSHAGALKEINRSADGLVQEVRRGRRYGRRGRGRETTSTTSTSSSNSHADGVQQHQPPPQPVQPVGLCNQMDAAKSVCSRSFWLGPWVNIAAEPVHIQSKARWRVCEHCIPGRQLPLKVDDCRRSASAVFQSAIKKPQGLETLCGSSSERSKERTASSPDRASGAKIATRLSASTNFTTPSIAVTTKFPGVNDVVWALWS